MALVARLASVSTTPFVFLPQARNIPVSLLRAVAPEDLLFPTTPTAILFSTTEPTLFEPPGPISSSERKSTSFGLATEIFSFPSCQLPSPAVVSSMDDGEKEETVLEELEVKAVEQVAIFIAKVSLEIPECFSHEMKPVIEILRKYFSAGCSAVPILMVILKSILLDPNFWPQGFAIVRDLSVIFGDCPSIGFNDCLEELCFNWRRYDPVSPDNCVLDGQRVDLEFFWYAVQLAKHSIPCELPFQMIKKAS